MADPTIGLLEGWMTRRHRAERSSQHNSTRWKRWGSRLERVEEFDHGPYSHFLTCNNLYLI